MRNERRSYRLFSSSALAIALAACSADDTPKTVTTHGTPTATSTGDNQAGAAGAPGHVGAAGANSAGGGGGPSGGSESGGGNAGASKGGGGAIGGADNSHDAAPSDGDAARLLDAGRPGDAEGSGDSALDAGSCALRELNIVAHQDDELLFLIPDMAEGIRAGHCVRTMYLTAGDAGRDIAYSLSREMAIRAVYATMAGVPDQWTESQGTFAGKTLRLATLNGARISVLFTRLPDGGDGTGFPAFGQQSMTKLVAGNLTKLTSIDNVNSFTRAELIATMAAVVNDTRPDLIHLQEFLDEFGGDHPDHVAGSSMANEAQAQYTGTHRVLYHRGYDLAANPPNLSDAVANPDWDLFLAYAQKDSNVCPMPCPTGYAHPPVATWRVLGLYYDWVHQHFPYFKGSVVGYGGKCLTVRNGSTVPGAAVDLETCAATSAQIWSLGTDGHFGALGLCLEVTGGNSANGTPLQMAACQSNSAQQRWTYGQVALGDAGLTTTRLRGLANKCMNARTATSGSDAVVEISDCTVTPPQGFWYYAGH